MRSTCPSLENYERYGRTLEHLVCFKSNCFVHYIAIIWRFSYFWHVFWPVDQSASLITDCASSWHGYRAQGSWGRISHRSRYNLCHHHPLSFFYFFVWVRFGYYSREFSCCYFTLFFCLRFLKYGFSYWLTNFVWQIHFSHHSESSIFLIGFNLDLKTLKLTLGSFLILINSYLLLFQNTTVLYSSKK